MRYLLLIVLFAVAPASYGYDIVLHGASYHFDYLDRSQNFNEFNPGIGVETDKWAAGYFYNSYRDHTFYGAGKFLVEKGNRTESGLFLGLATGYSKDRMSGPGGIAPLAGAYFEYRGVKMMLLVPGVLALSVRF